MFLLKKLYFKKLQLFSFLFLILFYSFKSSKVMAFNSDDYEPDYSQKHNVLDWRHSDGHIFSDNARVFMVFQESNPFLFIHIKNL
ncbi:hypothetical protein MBSPM3_v1c0400 [Maize bushy stunt phytoplasma]|uniref:Secreted protein n=1 Tax=Maize bushy stunt phytoplasma TaxID=202462 RepID=A0ABN4RY66_9MOLU|nr:hypothetical protein MBSPM3_v1c0400 [Maize bushy stunt phytoplasma]